MKRVSPGLGWVALIVLLTTAGGAMAQTEFTVTDITGWTAEQRDALPFFQRWVPSNPAAAPNFTAEAHNLAGQVAGQAPATYGTLAHVATDTTATAIAPFGNYYWQYLYWDGTDYHFQNGYVSFTHAYDINASGIAVGDSTLTSSGTLSYAYTAHAIMFDPATNTMTDLTPAATKAAAHAINDAGQITGWIDTTSGRRAFLRYQNGVMVELDTFWGGTTANAINANGVVVGSSLTQDGIIRRDHPFANEEGTAIVDLGLPTQNGVDAGSAYDVNTALWAVGATWQQDQSYEHFAALWQKIGGAWQAYDLNELLIDADVILENAIAINEQGYIIARGRPDGSDLYGSALYLLTPDSFATPVSDPRSAPIPEPATIVIAAATAMWRRQRAVPRAA